jgi:hypothetical protein
MPATGVGSAAGRTAVGLAMSVGAGVPVVRGAATIGTIAMGARTRPGFAVMVVRGAGRAASRSTIAWITPTSRGWTVATVGRRRIAIVRVGAACISVVSPEGSVVLPAPVSGRSRSTGRIASTGPTAVISPAVRRGVILTIAGRRVARRSTIAMRALAISIRPETLASPHGSSGSGVVGLDRAVGVRARFRGHSAGVLVRIGSMRSAGWRAVAGGGPLAQLLARSLPGRNVALPG